MFSVLINKIIYFDRKVHSDLTDHRISFVDAFFSAFTGLGSMYLAPLFLGITYIYRPGFVLGIIPSFMVLLTSVFALKKTVDRKKPEHSPLTVDLTESFPSGHAALSSFLAVSYSQLLPELSPFMYLGATAVCISRVYLGAHYPSDVLAGASIGVLIGILI